MPNEPGIFDSPGARARSERFQRQRAEVVDFLGPFVVDGLRSAVEGTDESLTQLAQTQGLFNLQAPTVEPRLRPTPPPAPIATPTPEDRQIFGLQPPTTVRGIGPGPDVGLTTEDIGVLRAATEERRRPIGITENLGGLIRELETEVELLRPLTEPVGRALGRAGAEVAVPGVPLPLRALGVPDVPGRERVVGAAEEVGGIVAPEVLVPSNVIPIPILDDALRILAKGVPLAARLLRAEGRTATRAQLGELAAGARRLLTRTTDPAERQVLEEAAETLGREAPAPAVREVAEEVAPATARAAAVEPAEVATASAAGQVPEALAGQPTTVDKLTNLIRGAKRLKPEQRQLRTAELGRRAARAEAAMERVTGREQLRAGTAELAGKLPSPEFEAPEGLLTSDEINDLANTVGDFYRGKERTTFTRINTLTALEKILMGGLPQDAELGLLEEVFGPELVEAILGKRPLGTKVWEELMGVINAPRTLMTTFDVSAILRQAATTVGSREFYGNIPLYLRSFASQRFTDSVEASMRAHPLYQRALDDKLALTFGGRRALPLAEREEAFMLPGERTFIGNLIRKIPGVRQSERGHLTFLSKLRLDMYANNIDKVGPGEGNALASMLNAFSGRGEIGPLKDYTPLLSGLMFSARRQASLVQIPLSLFSRSPHVRKLAARNLMAFVGTGIGLLSMIKMSGLADVEMDPRSSNWGKIRVGPTRLDIWAGFQPLGRLIAQAASGQRKISSGALVDVDLLTVVGEFLRNKLSPAAGEAVDVLRGETALGENIAFTPEVIGREAYENLTSLFIQDIIETVREGGWAHGLLAVPAGFGVGIQSYTTPSEEGAARFNKKYPDLAPYNPEVHRVIVNADPELSAVFGKSEGAQQVEEALADPIADLAPVAEQVRQNNPNAGPQFRSQYSDFKKIAFGATSAAFADVEFRDPESDAGKLRQEFNELNPFSEQFFDVDSAQPDWWAYEQERDRLIGEIDALVPGFKDAHDARLRLPPELQDVETRFLQAQGLRNQLGDIPQFRGISVDAKRNVDTFLRQVRSARDRAKDEVGADRVLSVPDAIRKVGKSQDRSEAFIAAALALNSTSARRRLLNPEYVKFIVDNADQLLFFYPELRSDIVSNLLARQ